MITWNNFPSLEDEKKFQPIVQGQMLKKTSTENNVREKLAEVAEQVAPIETLRYLSQSLKKI